MGKKKAVVPRPFHEVVLEILESGEEPKEYRKLLLGHNCYGDELILAVLYLLTQCVIPEKEYPRIVLALIAASKLSEVCGIASALKHFKPGRKGLKELEKLLSAEYLATEEDSDEALGLRDLFNELGLTVPERPEEEAEKPAPKKPKLTN